MTEGSAMQALTGWHILRSELLSLKSFLFIETLSSSLTLKSVENNGRLSLFFSLVFKRAVILVYKENCKLKKKLVRQESVLIKATISCFIFLLMLSWKPAKNPGITN